MKDSTGSRIAVLLLAGFLTLCAVTGCSTSSTVQSKGGVVDDGTGKALRCESGFLGDYSQLKPGNEGQAALVYLNPAAQWSKYTRVILEPVQFWAAGDTKIPLADQQALTSYFYFALRDNLQKQFTLVNEPGPDVMKLEMALTDATAATPMLRSVSVIVPQARLLNKAQSLATGSYAFVGSAQTEGQIVDSMTGERLAAAIDKRVGGMGFQAAAQWKWGDAQNAMDFWAQTMTRRIAQFQGRSMTSNP